VTVLKDIEERLLDEALAWRAALESDDADWDGYTSWLEADPRHREAFDAIALTERIVDERAEDLRRLRAVDAVSVPRPARLRRGLMFGAVAAAVALAVGIPTFRPRADTIYATGSGETRKIALGEGIAVELAPSTRLIARHANPSLLELAQGDAYFVVSHDPGRPLSIKADDYAVTDIGTTFGMSLSHQSLSVSVAEGTVSVIPQAGDPAQVDAGQRLFVAKGAGEMRVGPIAVSDVGSWRQGRLVYDQTPLAVVVADISRYSGKTVTADPAVRSRPFSGVLAVGDGKRMVAGLADLTGLHYEVKGDSLRLGPAASR
jgi:transmembrane sensor